jgi:hypothetical protein
MPAVPKPRRQQDEHLLEQVREKPCAVCGMPGPSDASHIISRGAGGGDHPFNVLPKCRKHHTEWHTIGWYRFLGKYPTFAELLMINGWEIEFIPPSLFHRGLR